MTGGPPPAVRPASDERRHRDAAVEEWVFLFWTADLTAGGVSGHRLIGRRAWYWSALARVGEPLLHVTEWDITTRSDPMIVKAHALWAEHTCDAPFEQWSIGNETYAAALDDPHQALGRAYGTATPIAFDLEWYATGSASDVTSGYEQGGAVHGSIDAGSDRIELEEVPARRWHRWGAGLGTIPIEPALAHTGLRAPFAFPDGTTLDLVLAPDGWRRR